MTIETIFAAASQKPLAERAAFLDQACGTDAELRVKVERLLDAHDAAGSFLQPQTSNYESQSPSDEAVGTIIAGKYKLLERIGEGGMGSVWMAQQSEPVKRLVAVKLIKAGMDSKAVLARFEAERQALAVMDHPNIAKILDGGMTSLPSPGSAGEGMGVRAAVPYFVMELVKGVPITKYCDENKLTPRERLELFVPVCQAIQHAHQKGIIHRDIKPSNVMVALYDDKPVPKVIDFGVAKATGQTLTEQTLNTGFGGIVGTPEYMSPEQASLNNFDIDTRSDIYSLGVLLYELLAGSPPFKRKELQQAGLMEILRVIREEEPPKPSTKLSTADALPSLSANRGTEPKKLTGILRNELDWIVMKALEKDRARRYETANGFAADVNRYLAGEPVNAHPPSTVYRMKKFLRKNKVPVIASAAIASALLVGMLGFAWQARVAQHARDLAQDERSRAVAAESQAKKRADELQRVSNFQAQMLGQVDPTVAGILLTNDVKAKFEAALAKSDIPLDQRAEQSANFLRQWYRVNATDAARELIDSTILRPAVAAIDKQFPDQPVVDAALRQVLADRYRELGLFDAALPLQERALKTACRELGEDHPDTVISMNQMGMLLREQGKLAQAEPFLRQALEKQRRLFGEDNLNTIISWDQLALLLHAQGKLNEAEPILSDALQRSRRIFGEDHPDTVTLINNLGQLLRDLGRLNDAEVYFRDSLEKCRRLQGEENPHTLIAINQMALLLQSQAKLEQAEILFREGLQKSRRILGEEHPNTVIAIHNMGGLLRAQEKQREAEPFFRESLEKCRRTLGDNHPGTMIALNQLGLTLQELGKLNEAEPLFREAIAKSRRVLGDDHQTTLTIVHSLGCLLVVQGQLNQAEPLLYEAAEKFRKNLGEHHPSTLIATNSLGSLRVAQGQFPAAVSLLTTIESPARKAFTGGNARRVASLLMNLGKARKGQEEFAPAESAMLEAHSIFGRTVGDRHRDTNDCVRAIGDLYLAWHAAEPGKGYDAKAAEWKAKLEAKSP